MLKRLALLFLYSFYIVGVMGIGVEGIYYLNKSYEICEFYKQ